MRLTRQQWLSAGGWIALAWAVATPVAALFSVTFGLISGLIVLIVPAYALFSWLCLVAVAVCLAQWRGRRALARVLAALIALLPAGAAVAAYLRSRLACRTDADPAGCLAYLDGSPLLVVGIGATVVMGLLALAVAWYATTSPAVGTEPAAAR